MAGKKKAKKPAANPARGFATTSIASKPRVDPVEGVDELTAGKADEARSTPLSKDVPPPASNDDDKPGDPAEDLSPEEFEKRLEEADLQLFVERHAQKCKRDAQRQKTRLETDRRLLRAQAESIYTKKWLPQELMDQILDLIQAEGRFAASSVSSEGATSKLLPVDELAVRLWTLQKTLEATGFDAEKVQQVLQYILDIAPNLSPGNKGDSIWGLDEALDWFARECSKDELPDYTGRLMSTCKAGKASCRTCAYYC